MRCDTHNHTRYSNLRLRDALAAPEALIDRAIELGLCGVAITDHESLSAHPKANMYAAKIAEKYPDFKVILGNEIYLSNSRPSDNHYHYILLAKDKIGHYQLRRLSSIAWLNGYVSKGLMRVDLLKSELAQIVKENPGHLIAQTACIGGELGQNILALTKAERNNDAATANKMRQAIVDFLNWNYEIFKEDFYLEVQPGVSTEQIIVNRRMLSIAQAFGIKMVATSDTHYLKKEDRYVHKTFLNSENKEREVDAFYQDTYLHSDEEMIEKFIKSDYDKTFVEQMFENSVEIYNKIENYSLLHTQQIPKVPVKFYPKKKSSLPEKYSVLNKMYESEDEVNRFWVNECVDKLHSLGKYNEVYLDELEEEADVKRVVGEKLSTNMYSYPIALRHYINLIWDCGSIVGAGRGSACAALNHYLLGVTQLDPIEWNFPFFRYMNRDTEGLGDIDIDISPSKIPVILEKIREERSNAFRKDLNLTEIERKSLGANYVCTFGTETSKSAILTACRGYRGAGASSHSSDSDIYREGIDVDIAQYLSSLVPSERGFTWSISDVYYGNLEKDRKPIALFKNTVDEYPGLLEIMLGIEGCISRRGRHASGVLFLNEDPYEFNAFMKTPSGEVVTQYDLHDAEACGSTKMDLLVTEVCDKLIQTVKFLQEDEVIEKDLSLKEVYNKYLHPDKLPYKSEEVWKAIQNVSVLSLFQFDSDSGRQGIRKVQPTNIIEMSAANGLIRLMTTEKGAETWLDKFARYKKSKVEYERDISKYHLTQVEKNYLNKYVGETYGIGVSQEQLMRVLMDENICNYSLKDANRARKIVSKKKMSEIPAFKEKVFATAKSDGLANYVWDYVVAPGLGYSFSDIHSVSYTIIGFQTAYIATRWNPIYWNTACLVVDSGSLEDNSETEIVGIYEPEAADLANGTTFEDLPDRSGKIKKTASTDYAKLAKAVGAIRDAGVEVSLIDINHSEFGFKPDVENNRILFGMKGLPRIGDDVVGKIIANRPYLGIKDFMARCPLTVSQMLSLIKSGAFDNVDASWASKITKEPRYAIMIYYIMNACGMKTRITMQNANGLIQYGILPKELEFEQTVFNFNKFLKANCKIGEYYKIENECYEFYRLYFDESFLEFENTTMIHKDVWDKLYKNEMNKISSWIKLNQDYALERLNYNIFMDMWNKYAKGTISTWEMETLCFYYHAHQLEEVDETLYGIRNFNAIESNEIDYVFKKGGKEIPIYKIRKIAGTVIAKNDTRASISLLTRYGVVNVKLNKEYYAMINRQISEVGEDGTKHVVDKSWLTRGNMLLVSGYRREDQFVAKTYKSTGGHQVYKIEPRGDKLVMTHSRFGDE